MKHLIEANSLLRNMKTVAARRLPLSFVPLPRERDLVVALQCDASFGGQPKSGSQSGFVLGISTSDILNPDVAKTPVALIDWGSHRIKRVVRSTLAAEAAAMAAAYDRALWLRSLLGEVLHGRQQRWEDQAASVAQITATDCQSLYDMLEKDTSMPTERRIALDLDDVRHYLRGGDRLEWVPTGIMMADQLTKHRPWEGPLADLVLGLPQWRETASERRARPSGPSRHRRRECTNDAPSTTP